MADGERWEVVILPEAQNGLRAILNEHGESSATEALNDILSLEEDPTPADAERLRQTKIITASMSADRFTAPSTAY